MKSDNPYQSPGQVEFTAYPMRVPRCDPWTFGGWTIVFGFNIVIPLLFGWEMTQDQGRTGMLLALLGVYGLGCVLCYFRPATARKLIAGSVLTGLSQLFPILHLMAGAFALEIVAHFEMAVLDSETELEHFTSEFGGLLATLLVAGMLILCAWAIGLVLGLMLPGRWFRVTSTQAPSNPAAESA